MDDLISRQAAIDEIRKCRFVVDAIEKIRGLPSEQPDLQQTCNQLATDCISRQAAIDAVSDACFELRGVFGRCEDALKALPSAQQTLYGYDIEHLKLIANVLQKENLPPERVEDALMDIGRIVAIVMDEFEETLRKAVEQCRI